MKKSLLFLAGLLTVGLAMARPVEPATARRVAEVYLQAQGMRNTAALVDVTSQTPFTEFYVFAAPEGGFALVSGDDCVIPILGYSTGNRFDAKELPEQVSEWLNDYEREIRFWRSLVSAGKEQVSGDVSRQWSSLTGGIMPKGTNAKSAGDTLVTSRWSQGLYYNAFCPSDTNHSSGHTPTGCVATAMGMVMKYWNYPDTGFSEHGYTHSNSDTSYGYQYANFGMTAYQWDSMPEQLTALTSEAQDSAVALFLYHCGVAVNMNYGVTGSSAVSNSYGTISSNSQDNALIKYFKYSPALHSVFCDDFSSSEWSALMMAEINAGRPVLYGGNGSGGHAFVLDGYDGDGCFHFNWGWNGNYNGFFPIGGLNPISTRTYNRNNRANIGVQPNITFGNGGTINVTANDNARGTVTPSVTYNFGDSIGMQAYPNHGYRFKRWSDGNPFISREINGTGGDYTFTADFEPVGVDTMILYGGGHRMTNYGWPAAGEYSWGVMYDSTYLQMGRELHGVDLYVIEDGDYDMYVYLGSDHGRTVVFDTTFTVDSTELNQWKTVEMHTPVVVDGWESMWVIFHKVSTGYPACVTSYSGINESFVSVNGDSFDNVGEQRQYSTMIRGFFRPTTSLPLPHVFADGTEQLPVGGTATFTASGTPGAVVNWTFPGGSPSTATGYEVQTVYNAPGVYPAIASITLGGVTATDTTMVLVVDYTEGDTISYCLDRTILNSGGTGDSTTWGIMFPSEYLHGRYFLDDVLLYVCRVGEYTLHVYQGGDTMPGMEIYTKDIVFDSVHLGKYCSCPPDSLLRVDTTQNLWIVFGSRVPYPAALCSYMDEPNSDWIVVGKWIQMHVDYPTLQWSWLIKAVISKTAPMYSVTVNCVDQSGNAVDSSLVTGAGTYSEGTTVTLEGSVQGCDLSLDFWITETGDTIYDNPYIFTINSDRTITAVFAEHGGIGDVNMLAIRLYPNPASERISVSVSEPGEMVVMDATGRTVLRQNVEVGINVVDVKILPSGIYYVKIGSAKASFIISH